VTCLDVYYTNHARARATASTWGKITVIHGKEDKVVPFWHGEEMARICAEQNGDTHTIFLAGRGHNDIMVNDICFTIGSLYLDTITEEEA
jgi:fermentation-respiration switch protein FrsA (DUF1100 family)